MVRLYPEKDWHMISYIKAEKEKSDAARIIAAVQESGKSVDEVLTLLSPTETSWKTKASSYKEEAIFLLAS